MALAKMPRFQFLPTRAPDRLTGTLGRAVARSGITANFISIVGFLGVLFSAWLITEERLVAAGIAFLAFSIFDMLDGAVARATDSASDYGAVLDAVLDRAAEAAMLGAIAWYFADRGEDWQGVATYLALFGSIAVSYMRARAEIDDIPMRGGLFRRQERIALLTAGLLFNGLTVVIVILAALTNFTALQRFYLIARELRARDAAAKGA
jgi:phosphatidylglycerophosphate synthase